MYIIRTENTVVTIVKFSYNLPRVLTVLDYRSINKSDTNLKMFVIPIISRGFKNPSTSLTTLKVAKNMSYSVLFISVTYKLQQ